MDEERERKKYIQLRNKLYSIDSNVDRLESKINELISTLENGFTIDKEIVEKESIDDILSGIKSAKSSISHTISIANRKI